MKKCKKCHKIKDLSEFGVRSDQADGLNTRCKPCIREDSKETYKKRKKQKHLKQKEWEIENKEHRLEYRRKKYNSKKRKKDYVDNLERDTWTTIKRRYPGITKEQYYTHTEKLKCDLCGKIKNHKKALSIDHDHETLKVRGSLCLNCNTGLGQFRDDIRLLEQAIKYLKERS
jgi:hypothetical protein